MSVALGPDTDLVGREVQAAALRERLLNPSVRLVTLTGRAGVGKTRLAREVVRGLGDAFGRVVTLDAAAPGGTGTDALTALARARTEGPGRAPGSRVLLLLDGCDHEAREAAAGAVVALADDPGVVVLATAVEPLGVYGEQLLPLGPLPVPGDGDGEDLHRVASVALFVRRARDTDPSFALTLENSGAVADICTLLGGLPLALELAALRLRLLPPRLLAARLRGRTTVLAGGPVNAPARHRSLAALAEWSCRGLDPAAGALLGRLSAYEPGFGLAAAGIADEEGLEPLMDRGLLTVVAEERGELRLAVPEPVRSHARTRAAEADGAGAAADAHAERYRRLVAAALPGLAGTGQDRLLREAAAESPNVLAALRRLHERGDGEAAAALVLGCHLPWLAQGRLREGLEWCDEVADCRQLPEALRARLADLSGVFALALGDPQESVRRHRRALALGKGVGDRRRNALASLRLGTALLRSGDTSAARSVLVTAHSALSGMGATGAGAEAAFELAAALRAEGDRRKAQEMLEKAEEAFRRAGDGRGLAGALRALAAMALEGDEPERAETALREALRLYEAIDERSELPAALEEFALLLLRTQPAQRPRAVRLLAAADVLRQRTGAEVPQEWRSKAEQARTELGARLDWPDFATAWAEGVRMAAPTAVAEALSAPAPSHRTVAGAAAEAQSLTPRQAQVALLVAEGLTNRHIAARLDISEWTVVNHVRQVMRRLGCTSRVQVAGAVGRWA
ncbi:LuxR C-terminal-related transcriptional regulator [Streptomyces castrisilvae]|uniref:LuxR C-terminal-related transcriptional regulator n=1 Tax=Streptomyces castrisilvae TaxID=3033811 RepID=A0ABY9HLW7_9ACTN|nr:LuxR C-terminal-related transcriptional regulator [Streptomyces sp. Mut1]WLQ35067.1 LuxR C-terminal-related transcriptional regulator [Streptomyces sp. Mut1]